MKKSELSSGMRVKDAEGNMCLIMLDFKSYSGLASVNCLIYLNRVNSWDLLDDIYDEDLKSIGVHNTDIVEVLAPSNIYSLTNEKEHPYVSIWKRDIPVSKREFAMTWIEDGDISILKSLSIAKIMESTTNREYINTLKEIEDVLEELKLNEYLQHSFNRDPNIGAEGIIQRIK